MSDFLAYFLTYPPIPVQFCPSKISNFITWCLILAKVLTYLTKNRTSSMNVPLVTAGIEVRRGR